MPLSDAKLRALKPTAKSFRVADGEGLFLQVEPTGSKLWRMAYRFDGKQKLLSFGSYPTVSLLDARSKRHDAKVALSKRIDPAGIKRQEKVEKKSAIPNTFRSIAERWFEANRARWVATYQSRLLQRFEGDIYPHIGELPINDIQPAQVLHLVRQVEKRGAVLTAKRIKQMCSAVFCFGIADSVCQSDPARDLSAALQAPKKVKHRTPIKVSELGGFLEKLDGYQGEPITRLAIKLILHTFVRTDEIRFAVWSEFEDLNGPEPLWRIPAERMKMKREHLVPLSTQAVAILREIESHNYQGRLLFRSPMGGDGPISGNTMIYALYKMGYHMKATIHGFRGTASTVLNEQEFNSDWIETQLAHGADDVRSVYNSAKYLKGRRAMMQWWSDFLDQQIKRKRAANQFEDLLG